MANGDTDVGKTIIGDGSGTVTGGKRENLELWWLQWTSGRSTGVERSSGWRLSQCVAGTVGAGRASFAGQQTPADSRQGGTGSDSARRGRSIKPGH
jgi:hypothetical protein